MNTPPLHRRALLKKSLAATTGALFAGSTAAFGNEVPSVKIEKPFHGAVLNRRHGKEVPGGLTIEVAGTVARDQRVTVAGKPARREGARFTTEVILREPETDIVVVAEGSGGKQEALSRVVWDRHSEPRYRFSIDDNSFFLRDIARKKYASLFDCFYLKILRDLHRKYKTKFVLNVYYTTEDGFTLPQFPDRYKREWEDNADWLSLAFHAHANDPPRPYTDTPPEKLIADLDRVAEQIVRFAGEKTYSPPTVIHFAMTRPTAFKPLAERGVRALSGCFWNRNGRWDINYNLDDATSEYLSKHDAWKDFDSGIVFSMVDIVCNNTPVNEVAPSLAPPRRRSQSGRNHGPLHPRTVLLAVLRTLRPRPRRPPRHDSPLGHRAWVQAGVFSRRTVGGSWMKGANS